MAFSVSLYTVFGLGAASLSALVAATAWRNRNQRGAVPFLWLMFALGGWSLVYGLQLSFTTASGQLPWQRVSLAVGGTIPTLWLVFTLHYLGREQWLTHRRLAALAFDPVLFAALTLTNHVHSLIWDGTTLVSTQAGDVLALSLTWGYYIHIGYAYVTIALGLGFFFTVFEQGTPVYRKQAGFLILGVLPPFAGNIAYTFRVSQGPLPALDPTPFLFVLTGVLWTLALYQFDLLDRTPLARKRIVDEMGDGLIVLDADRKIVNSNYIVGRVFDSSPDVGRPISELLPQETATADALEAFDGQTVTARVGRKQRAYDVDWSTLTDSQETTVGHMIVLRDITERNGYEQRLEVAQRVLRHNLRNDMAVIQAWADKLSDPTAEGHSEAARRITETTEELIELSDKTNKMVQMEPSVSSKRVHIDAEKQLSALTEMFADEYPDVTIEGALSTPASLTLPDEQYLLIPVENLLENAIEHNDADERWVRVAVESTDELVSVHVADNGPPIPDMERTVLENGTEDSLHHGSGLGLWLTYWSVTTVGGRVRFDQREPRGNVVTLEFPRQRDKQQSR